MLTSLRQLATARTILIFRVDYNQIISIIVPSIECLLTDFSAFEQKTSDGGDVKKVTPMMFSAYRLMVRPGRDGTRIFRFRRLFQQLCVDLAAQIEGERLNWIRFNQDKDFLIPSATTMY